MTFEAATGTAIAGLVCGACGLFAQTSPPDLQPYLNTAGGLASLGFAVWYAWYVTTKVMPERDTKHAATIEALGAKHTATVDALVREFRAEVAEQRATYQQSVAALRDRMQEFVKSSVSSDS